MNEYKFDLIDLFRIGWKRRTYILGFAFLAALGMAIYALTLKNLYSSQAVFFPSNALIGSRDNLFRAEFQDAIDQVGFETEVDRVSVIASSAPVMGELIEQFHMSDHYKIDTLHDKKGKIKTFKKFAKNYKVTKGANSQITLNFSDWDPQLSADILSQAIIKIQDKYRNLYVESGKGIKEALDVQMVRMDSSIRTLTDSLVRLREKYGIYEIISPSRQGDIHVKSRNAEGIEMIQNVEELKDQYVKDRAKYASLANEHITISHKSIPYLLVVQWPTPGGVKVSPFRTIMVASTFIGALFLGLLIAYIVEYLPQLKSRIMQ